jgi:phenylalanyl-tRNA synthetase alpha chain
MTDDHPDRSLIEALEREASGEISEAADLDALEQVRIKYLGRKGKLTLALRSIGRLPADERPAVGGLINEVKGKLSEQLESRLSQLSGCEGDEEPYPGDPNLPGRRCLEGGRHILKRTIRDIKEIFFRMGYSMTDGPDVELDYYNFEALNFPVDHPSRDLQDTFYVNKDILLRTQTSPVQVRYMEKHKPPLRIISPGRVYRNESPDPSHAAEFFQVEGLFVDKDVSLADLRNDVTFFVHQFFGPDAGVRFRPHFFPFTEPSAEVDMTCFSCHGKGCSICQKTGWLEIMGAGMVHPNVFKYAGYDPDSITGFAFGMGVERITMLKYGIDDIRRFLVNDIRFLRQFWRGMDSTGVQE